MAEKSKSLELKVGIFVFIGILILAWFVFLSGVLNCCGSAMTSK